ncbi:cell wall-binding repeat-containing protein [Dehalobacter sp. DCM]|uniref:cell wall-binding repeat-containing protein n=1 Tax=Dehalobacter sp. DCM TaxID=2907827 RepID=UPI003081515D|nr:cell wall-binding repeat-containing protein [Dehalobacter sp. DCM]
MRKKFLSCVLALSLILSMIVAIQIPVSATQQPAAVFTDGDLDQVYFAGDTLSFNLTGIPVGVSPAGIPAGTTLRVCLGVADLSGFSDFTVFSDTLSNGMGDGTGFYVERTLQADGTLDSPVTGTLGNSLTVGIVAVKLYVYNGSSWQNVLQGQTPDYIVLTEGTKNAMVGMDGVMIMPDGVTSDPVIGSSAQDTEDLRDMDISFSKTIADGITGTIAFTGLNLMVNSSDIAGLDDGLIMEQVAIPTDGATEQYTMGVDVTPSALAFLESLGAVVSISSLSFDGLTTDDFSAVAADVAGGTVSNLAFNDDTNTVSFTVNHFSNYTLSMTDSSEETDIFYDDFESYAENTFPLSFTQQYNGTGDANQTVITAQVFDGSTGKVFQLEGAPSWSSEQFVTLPVSLPDNLILDAYIKPVTSSRNAELALRNLGVGPWGTRISSIWFEGDGTIVAVQNGNDADRLYIENYTVGNWYRVTLDNDMVSKTYDVYINGVVKASDIPMNPSVAPTTLSLIAHNVSTSRAYFDNVGLYAQLPDFNNYVCEITDTTTKYTTLTDALAEVTDGQTIKLLADIDYTDGLVLENKHLIFNLNGYTLNVSSTDDWGQGIEVHDGSILEIDDSLGGELNAIGSNNPEKYGSGLRLDGNSTATVTNVISYGYANGADCTEGTLTIKGDVHSGNNGVFAQAGGQVIVKGTIYSGGQGAISSLEDTSIIIDGDVISSGSGITCGAGTLLVKGDIQCTYNGVSVAFGGSAEVYGDVTVGGAFGNYAVNVTAGTATINGTLTAPKYISLADTDFLEGSHTGVGSGYYVYTKDSSTAKVKIKNCLIPGCFTSVDDGGFNEYTEIDGEIYYHVSTAKQLAHVNDHLSYNFIQTADIDLTGIDWTPIGLTYDTPFTGVYNGNGHSITNLNVNQFAFTTNKSGGLFGALVGDAAIKNLDVSGNVIYQVNWYATSSMTGGIAASMFSSGGSRPVIDNCSFTGNVTAIAQVTILNNGISSFAGGIVGYARDGVIKNSSYKGGNILATTIPSSGSTTRACAGGIAGNLSENASIINCYSTEGSDISATGSSNNRAGGIAGQTQYSSNISVCYNAGSVDATPAAGGTAEIGGISGQTEGASTISDSYWLDTCGAGAQAGSDNSTATTGKMIDAAMKATGFRDTLNSALNAVSDQTLYTWLQASGNYPELSAVFWKQPTSPNIFPESRVNVVTQRLSGSDRFATSVSIAESLYSGPINHCILATGFNFPDALSGSSLANLLDAPILLGGNSAQDSQEVLNYIRTHLTENGTLYILGGQGAVSEKLLAALREMGVKNIQRISGQDRYLTNLEILKKLNVAKGTPVFITTGENFPDALSISSIAASLGYPVLLSGKDSLNQASLDYLKNLAPGKIYFIGGSGAVSEALAQKLQQLTGLSSGSAIRIQGQNRYLTALNIAKYFNLDTKKVLLATGTDFPDALSGTTLAAHYNSPVLLVGGEMQLIEEYLDSQAYTDAIICGGTGAIPQSIIEDLFK